MTVHLEIPLTEYMPLAGAAALHGMDVATYAKSRSQASLQAAPTRVADHAAATLAAASAEAPLPAAAPPAEPEPAPAAEPQPMDPAAEDAMLSLLGA